MVKSNFAVTKILVSDFHTLGLPACDIGFVDVTNFLLALPNIGSKVNDSQFLLALLKFDLIKSRTNCWLADLPKNNPIGPGP